jgi:hypothetical protein
MGFGHVESAPLVRSSYHADEQISRAPDVSSTHPPAPPKAEDGPEAGALPVIHTR